MTENNFLLQTERLTIKEARLEDKDFFFSLLTSPNWLKYIGDRGIKTPGDAANYLQSAVVNSYWQNGFGLYKVILTAANTPIGVCGFLKRNYLDSVDIGYAVLPAYEGQGYTYEAARAVLEFGQAQLGLSLIYGITTHNNVISRHLLEKLGLHFAYKRVEEDPKNELLIFSN